MRQKTAEKIKLNSNGKKWVRFDLELTEEELSRLDALCSECNRSRKNFTETLVILAIKSDSMSLDLGRLGVTSQPKQ